MALCTPPVVMGGGTGHTSQTQAAWTRILQFFPCMCYSKAGITGVFEGHHGPVTGLSCHSAGGPVDFSHLFISSSFDWTVKLWSTKVRPLKLKVDARCYIHAKLAPPFSFLQSTRPLYSFEDSCDYVYDAMWSPTHPALFACVDLAGRLDLWNLNNDTEVHTHTLCRNHGR